jgi:dipeptidyl aminopeptidase/acylaminoacyl peptidase
MKTRLVALLLSSVVSLPVLAQGKPTLTPSDYGRWESLTAARLAPHGGWLAYGVNRVNEENELRVRGGARDTTIVIPFGVQPQFAATSQWVAYLVGVAPKERDRLVKEKKPVRTAFGARNLMTGDSLTVADASAFAFSADGQFMAVTKYAAEGKKSSDVVVLSLATGTRLVLNNVTEQAWSSRGAQLAFAVTVDGGAGNALQLFDGRVGAVQVLDASLSVYRGIAWRANSSDLAVLRSVSTKEFADTAHTILAWRDVGGAGASAPRILDASAVQAVPAGFRVADYRRPSWSKDGRTLYVGLRQREPVAALPKKSEEKVSDVEIWHPKDVHVIPEQRSSEQRDLRSTLLARWILDTPQVMVLSTNVAEQATVLDGDRFVTETDRTPYPFGQMFGRRDLDVYRIDVTTGARTTLLTKIRYSFGGDPTGRRHVWFDGRDYWAVEVASGTRTNLTARLAAGRVDFVDREDDHPMDVLPPIGTPFWSKDGNTLLVNGAYDVWALALDGSGGRMLTNGARDGLEYRVVSFAGFGGTAAERAVDLSKPVYLSLYGKRSKKSGYARLANGAVTTLTIGDAQYAALAKADSSDTYIYTRQRFDESPNVFMAKSDLADAKAMSNTNTFQRDFAWGKAELMNFTSSIGTPLQAILYYPANYVPGTQYPMIVYTYERLTQGLHRYLVPRENDYYNANVFTQQGYFVLMPDIVFRPREPGISVLHAVEPAVRRVLARGLVDPARVGHAGHSQGGYEAAFLATHSSLFATAVMGAGISDLVSFAGQMHWSSVPEFDHWETGQFRMQVAPWEDVGAMTRNSPIAKIHEMRAKSLLIEIGGEDPTVDMRQGVELYNYARRAGKNAVMLLYPGEGHGLGKKENAVDYQRRILQWFAHYLKGEPAASWITDGQSWLERKKRLDANK